MRRFIVGTGLFYGFLAGLAALILLVTPVLASYYCEIGVTESNGTSYDLLPVIASADIDYLADNHFISDDGRDLRVKTGGGAEIPFMLKTDSIIFASGISANIENTFRFTTGNSLLDDYYIVTGDGGYVTIADHANLELGDTFEIEVDGYIDTSITDDLLVKTGSCTVATDGAGHVTATIDKPADFELTVSDDSDYLSSEHKSRAGAKITNCNQDVITDVSFVMWKNNAPTGTAYVRIRRASDSAIIGTFGSIDVSTLTTGQVWYDFTDDVTNPVNQDVYVCVEYDGGSAVNFIGVRYDEDLTTDNICRAYYDGTWFDIGGDEPTIKVHYQSDITVTAAVDKGEHKITLVGGGTDIKIYSDDTLKDTSTSIRAAVDNGNNWILGSDALPYYDYYTHSTDDTARIEYNPDDIISGTTLPNELAAGTHDGTITYGTNPAGIAVSLGGLETYAVSYTTDPAPSQDIIRPTTAPLFDVNLERLSANPIQPIVAVIAAGINLTERLVWLAGAFILLFIIVLIALGKSDGDLAITFFSGAGWSLIMYLIGIFMLWPMVVLTIAGISSLIYEKVVSL